MDPRPGGAPTVLRMVLGKRLQDLREKAGLSFEQAGRALDVTHATIRRMEKAEVGLKIPYVEKLLVTYGITAPEEIGGFLSLAREANRPGWWHSFRDVLPEWFSAFVSLEGEASVIRAYEPHYVPGLLQIPTYARAVLRAGLPHAPADEIERLVTVRIERQALLSREGAPLLWVVMDETVLQPADRRPQGDARPVHRADRGHRAAQRTAPGDPVRGRTAPGDVRPLSYLPVPAPGDPGHRLHRKPGGRCLFRRP